MDYRFKNFSKVRLKVRLEMFGRGCFMTFWREWNLAGSISRFGKFLFQRCYHRILAVFDNRMVCLWISLNLFLILSKYLDFLLPRIFYFNRQNLFFFIKLSSSQNLKFKFTIWYLILLPAGLVFLFPMKSLHFIFNQLLIS